MKVNKQDYILILLLIFFTFYFKLYEKTYVILKYNYEKRLISNYGYCEKNSYGFVNFIDRKYNFKENLHILNDEDYPLSEGFIYKAKKPYNEDYLIILNYTESTSKINLKDFEVIEKFKNCMLLKKND